MTPLPKRRFSHGRSGNRASHQALRLKTLAPCPQCKTPRMPHRVCPVCGTYNGREVVTIKSKKAAA